MIYLGLIVFALGSVLAAQSDSIWGVIAGRRCRIGRLVAFGVRVQRHVRRHIVGIAGLLGVVEVRRVHVFELLGEQRLVALALITQDKAVAHGHIREDHHFDPRILEHRRIRRSLLLLFAGASVMVGQASSIETLIGWRGLQGLSRSGT